MLVDASQFPVGRNIDYTSDEEVEELAALEREAAEFLERETSVPVAELVLAFGVGQIIGLFLVRFAYARKPEDWERWVVVGNLPSMHFETDDALTPKLALQLYCAIAQDWADNVIEGRDLSDSYPIEVAPTPKHAKMLLGRVDFIRQELIPLAEGPPWTPNGDK
jgi:hypothetical protein